MNKKAPETVTRGLTKEMIEHVVPCPIFGWQLRHPLMIEQFLSPEVNERWATNFTMRQQILNKYLENREFNKAIFLCERPFRFNEYLRHVHGQTDKEEQADLLLKVWIDSESPYVNREYWEECFLQLKDTQVLKDTLKSLTFPITVYRGFSVDEHCDVSDVAMSPSWTTSKDVAKMFAGMKRVTSGKQYIASTVLFDDSLVYAFTDEREEKELILSLEVVEQEINFEEIF